METLDIQIPKLKLFPLPKKTPIVHCSASGPVAAPADWAPPAKQWGTHALHTHTHTPAHTDSNTQVGSRAKSRLLCATEVRSHSQTHAIHLNCLALLWRSQGEKKT